MFDLCVQQMTKNTTMEADIEYRHTSAGLPSTCGHCAVHVDLGLIKVGSCGRTNVYRPRVVDNTFRHALHMYLKARLATQPEFLQNYCPVTILPSLHSCSACGHAVMERYINIATCDCE